MCLDLVNEVKVRKTNKSYENGIAYKVMEKDWDDEKYFNSVCRGTGKYTFNKWYHEKDFRDMEYRKNTTILASDFLVSYPLGFHSFINHKDASCYHKEHFSYSRVVVKVRVKKVVATGFQGEFPIIVSKEIRFIKIIDER